MEPDQSRPNRTEPDRPEIRFGYGVKAPNAFRRAMAEKRETFNKCRTEPSNAFKVADRLDWTWAGAPMVPPGFNPVLSVPRYETAAARRAGDPFEPEEIEAIVATAQQYLRPDYVRTVLNAPSRSTVALPLFLLFTGLRKNEGMGLTWTQLNQSKGAALPPGPQGAGSDGWHE
jgi:hypothetical protein